MYEEAVEKICRRLGARYTPPYLGDLRLPFSERFMKEVKDLNLDIALYGELMLIVDDFTRKFAAGDWLESERLISYFQMTAHYKLKDVKMFYPEIIKGVCELQMGRFAEAEETFLQATRHPKGDENAFGGLGQVYFRRHRYEEALVAYQQALKMCPKGKDLEVRVNILATQVQMGLRVDDPGALDEVDLDAQSPDDWIKIMNLKGILHFKKGEYSTAIQVFESMRRRGLYEPTSSVYHCLALKEEGRYEEAMGVLRSEAERSGDPNLYHHLADLCVSRGRLSEALDIYRNKLCGNQTATRQYMVEYARILKKMGDGKAMKEICEKVLGRDFFKPPGTAEDFYYDGFANYLLGRHDRARYDYERSAGFFEKYYDELNP
jgi:pentatricopeptide repeat protein